MVLHGWNMHVVWVQTWLQGSLASVLPHHGHTWSCPLLMFWDVAVQQESIRPSCSPHLEDQASPGVGLLFSLLTQTHSLLNLSLGLFFPPPLPPGLLSRMQLWILCLFFFKKKKNVSFGIPLCGLLKSMARLSGRDHDPTPLSFSHCPEPWGFNQFSRWTLLSHVNIPKLDHSPNTEKNWVPALILHTQGIGKWFAQRRGAGWEDKPTLHV